MRQARQRWRQKDRCPSGPPRAAARPPASPGTLPGRSRLFLRRPLCAPYSDSPPALLHTSAAGLPLLPVNKAQESNCSRPWNMDFVISRVWLRCVSSRDVLLIISTHIYAKGFVQGDPAGFPDHCRTPKKTHLTCKSQPRQPGPLHRTIRDCVKKVNAPCTRQQ